MPNAAFPQQLGLAQITADFTTTSASFVDVTGMALPGTVVGGAYPLRYWLVWEALTSTVNGDIAVVQILRGATVVATALQVAGQTTGNGATPYWETPGAGTYNFKAQMQRYSGTGTNKIGALVVGGTYAAPASLCVEEING